MPLLLAIREASPYVLGMTPVRMKAERQRERDVYYMALADAVRTRANCLGSEVGAVLVVNNRVIGTGYNGTPADFDNCRDGGCLRCSEHHKKGELEKESGGEPYESPHPETVQGKALDICFCVHAEQNALLSAARHGIAVADATLYTTHQPCFSCLKGIDTGWSQAHRVPGALVRREGPSASRPVRPPSGSPHARSRRPRIP
jgi:deoxycytidylate deaminase